MICFSLELTFFDNVAVVYLTTGNEAMGVYDMCSNISVLDYSMAYLDKQHVLEYLVTADIIYQHTTQSDHSQGF